MSTMPRQSEMQGTTRRQVLRILAFTGAGALTWSLVSGRFPKVHIIRRNRQMMGTYVEITIIGEDKEACISAADGTLDRMAAVEKLLSRHDANSELSTLVRDGQLSGMSDELAEVLELAQQVSEWGHGAFDITVQPVLDLYAQQSAGSLPSEDAIEAARALVNYQDVQMDGDSIKLLKPGMRLTLDGIGKGYIVDQGVAMLRSHGITNVFLDAGGDLVASGGKAAGRPWRIGIQNPRGTALQARFDAKDRAIATSGDYMQFYTDDYEAHHIIDPRTGRSAPDLASSTVIAPSAALADALATLTMVLGPKHGRELLESLPDCEGYLVSKDQAVTRTGGFAII